MITAKAIGSIEWLFEKSMRENSVVNASDTCTITPSGEQALEAKNTSSKTLVVHNISSYLFRIVTLAEFENNHSTVTHLSKKLRRPDNELDGSKLQDAYAEFVNLICGTVNRNLSPAFPHIGMSTPGFVDSACSGYIETLNPVAIRSFDINVNDSARFKTTICVCVTHGSKPLDFSIDRLEKEVQTSGELELF